MSNVFSTTTPVPATIPNNNPTGVDLFFTVSGLSSTSTINVVVFDITNNNNGDLLVTLTDPNSTVVTLVNRINNGTGTDNGTSMVVTLDDQAATSIQSAGTNGPLTGTYRPSSPLTGFSGNPNGTWILNVADFGAGIDGSVNSASFTFNTTYTPNGNVAIGGSSICSLILPSVDRFDFFLRNQLLPYAEGVSSTKNFDYYNRSQVYPALLGSDSNFNYLASGGLFTGETNTVKVSFSYNASGPLYLNGIAGIPYLASGNLILGGTSQFKLTLSQNSSGLLSLGGTNSLQLNLRSNASGLLSLGGETTAQPTYTYSASGLLSLGGASITPVSASGSLSLGGTSNNKLSFVYVASGSLLLDNSANVNLIIKANSSGNLLTSGISDAIFSNYSYTASGKLDVSSGGRNYNLIISYNAVPRRMLIVRSNTQASKTVAPWKYTGNGGLSLGNSAPVFWFGKSSDVCLFGSAEVNYVVYIIGPDPGLLSLGGAAGVVASNYSYTAGGKILFGDEQAQITRYFEASGGLSTGSTASSKLIYERTASGGLTFTGKSSAFVIFNITKTFSWSISQGIMRTYRVEGKCRPAKQGCPPVYNPDLDSCTSKMQFVTNIQAHSLQDLCNKITQRGGLGAINKIQVWSLPTNKSDWGPNDNINCNTLSSPLPFSQYPECIDFTVDQTLTVGIKSSSLLQIVYDLFTYEASGSLNCSGVTTDLVGPSWSQNSSGKLNLSGSANVLCDVYKSYTASGLLSLGGITTATSTFLGDYPTGAKVSASLSNLKIVFGFTEATTLTPSTEQIDATCCEALALPQIIYIKHDLTRSEKISNFLSINGFTLPPVLKMSYSRQRNSWYSNVHYIGNSTNNTNQLLNFVFEFGCLSGNAVGSDSDLLWTFSLLITARYPDESRTELTRLLVEFDPVEVCRISGDLNFNFSFDLINQETTPALAKQVFFADYFRAFISDSYSSDPNVDFEISVNPPTVDAGLFNQSVPLNRILLGV